jgi:protein-S-isoprenylcysteine O-methyltransferase Ste14
MTVAAALGVLGELLAWAAWIAWLLLGFARARPQAGDAVDDRGTWWWAMSVLLASVAAAVAVRSVVPATAIPGSRGIILLVGAAVALSGAGLRQWSIVTLGRFFTERVTICRDHQVVTSGPYRLVRHPGYAGTLLTVAGLAVTLRNWLSLLVVTAGFLVSHVPRILVEERVLEHNLGEPYRQFERTRKRLIPGLW